MNPFTLFSFTKLMHPWVLFGLLGVAALFAAECLARPAGVFRMSTGETAARIRSPRTTALRCISPALRATGLALWVVALARPMDGLRGAHSSADVVDIMLCVDVSGSMKARDLGSEGEGRSRLLVTKEAVRDFLRNRKMGEGDRFGPDRVGLVLYAGYAWTQCPLTLDYAVIDRELERAEIDEQDRRKQGTAIGSAIGLAVSKLRKSEAQSKVIVLLTDGRHNRGELDPVTAAYIAQDYGIRVYTIGAGSKADAFVARKDFFGGVVQVPIHLPVDTGILRRVAGLTGGRYYGATDSEGLRAAYEEISELETTRIDVNDYYEYEEAFAPWVVLGALVTASSIASRRLWFEAIP